MSSKDVLPRCPACALKAADNTRLDEITVLSAADLDEWEKIQPFERRADAIHEFDESWIVGVYHLDQFRLCSYEDKGRDHEHLKGFCAWSRCGLLFLLGKDCAKKYIPRYDQWIGAVNDTKGLQREREALKDSPIEILESLRALAASFERRLAGLENLKRHRRQLYEAVRNAHLRRELSVQVRREAPETETSPAREEWATEQLQGTVIFEDRKSSLRISLDDVRAELERAKAFANEATPDRANRDNYKAFQKTRRHLRGFDAKLRRRLADFEVFWTERNLKLALIRTYRWGRVPADVDVEGATIVLNGPPRRVLGMEG